MWCKHCRQDVPGIVVTDGAASMGEARGVLDGLAAMPTAETLHQSSTTRFVCARCGEVVGSDPAYAPLSNQCDATGTMTDSTKSSSSADSFETWQWELDQELHDVRRLLVSTPTTDSQSVEAIRYRIDNPVENVPPSEIHNIHARRGGSPNEQTVTRSQPRGQAATFSWLVLALGVMGFVCGAVLLGWSLVVGRADLWDLGLPIALGGQAVLLLGFLMLMERVWRDGRKASYKLNDVDEQLYCLKQAAAMTGTTPHAGPQQFYTHLTDGAHPNLLLADIRGQLDSLAHKIAEQD